MTAAGNASKKGDGALSEGCDLGSEAGEIFERPTPYDMYLVKRNSARRDAELNLQIAEADFSPPKPERKVEALALLRRLHRDADGLALLDERVMANWLGSDGMQAEADDAQNYQRKLLNAADLLECYLHEFDQDPDRLSTQNPQSRTAKTTPVKTPKLELTKFDGNPLEYQSFKDDFMSSVDQRSDLSIVDKFKLLKQSLEGEALEMTRGYYLTNHGYAAVKDALDERFGNPQVAVVAHIKALLQLPAATHEVDSLIRVRDSCEAHIRSLEGLGLKEENYGLILAPLLLSKLPRFVKMELHRRHGSKQWALKDLREHLKCEIEVRDKSDRCFDMSTDESKSREEKHKKSKSLGSTQSRSPDHTGAALLAQGSQRSPGKLGRKPGRRFGCIYCDGEHYTWLCDKYTTVDARQRQLGSDRCLKCFGKGHKKGDCKSRHTCLFCGKGDHHSSLCYEHQRMKRSQDKTLVVHQLNADAPEFHPANVNAVNAQVMKRSERGGRAVLETAFVDVTGEQGSAKACVVFDTGSTLSFVRKELCEKIGAKREGNAVATVGRFGDAESKHARFPLRNVSVNLRDGSILELTLRELPTLSSPIKLTTWNRSLLPSEIKVEDLADQACGTSEVVDLDVLLGLDYYYDIVGPELWRGESGLVVKGTAVGNIITGFLRDGGLHDIQNQLLVAEGVRDSSSLFDLERFWRLEDIGIKDPPGQIDDQMALEQFKATIQFENGRYHVQWPFKSERPELPTNYNGAFRRLKSVWRNLKQNPQLAGAYDQIFQDQLCLGVIEEAPEVPQGLEHYLPHRAVVTPGKETTKVRVVFDASAKESAHGPSLNDVMYRGPVFLNDLVGMLLRFRLPQVAVVSDVEKAFLQIALQVEHRDCTRFLWLKDPTKAPTPCNLVVYRMARVGFGMKASPFLLAATIIYHMLRAATAIALEIKDNTYMDNVIGGRSDTEGAKRYYSDAKGLFREMQMNLREWHSNDRNFIANLPEADRGRSSCPSVLGLKWDTDKDLLHCSSAALPSDSQVTTKRSILSFVSSTFDPCGWFSAVTVRGKVIMQDLWKSKKGWDEAVDQRTLEQWKPVQTDIANIPTVELPRRVEPPTRQGPASELHVFCDASRQAYAAAVYLATRNEGQISSDLLFAKARVAPIKKPLTIPQLELMATVLGVRMLDFVSAELKLNIAARHLWTDSTCVLGWLKSEKVNVVFVENRLKEIRRSSDLVFGHVKTEENPADIPSRSMVLDALKENELWWKGPTWLRRVKELWPYTPAAFIPKLPPDPVLISRIDAATVEEVVDTFMDITRHSTLGKLLRVTAYVFRAIDRMKNKTAPSNHVITARELQKAKAFWEKRVQQQCFPSLKDRPPVEWKNRINQLGLYADHQGFVRCSGRFANADLSAAARNPKLLPPKHWFTTLVIRQSHAATMHTGLKGTLAIIRQSYWIAAGRTAVKQVLHNCPTCRRHFGGHFRTPTEPPLPAFRSKLKRPFACVGIDYLGPLFIRVDGKNDKQKVWVALFTCATVRAVHLELVTSLTAEDFLLCLRRFMALYGEPELVISDNAKQFTAANRTLDKLWQEAQHDPAVQEFAASHGITWKFITEKAPWFGAFYERLVALVKHALKASLGKWSLTYVELGTLLYEVSFVLNGRPLTYTEDDPADFVLTPAHLLFRSRDMFPEVIGEVDPAEKLRLADALIQHWKAGQNLLREFWDIWQKDYLLALRESWRSKRERGVSSLPAEPGTVVLVKEPLPRGMWKIGRISKIKKSDDGKVRSVEVRLPGGSTLTRPVTLLYPVEAAIHGEDTGPGEPLTASEDKGGEALTSRPKRRAAVAAREGAKRCLV